MAVDPSTLTPASGGGANPYALLALQLGSLGLSAGQAAAARRRLQQLRMPNRPLPTRNPLLQQRISQAQQEAQLGTDIFRREREASTARAAEQGRQIASQMGGATYAAMMQNQAVAGDAARREGLLQDEGLRMQRQGQLDQLIGMDMSQDARADQMAMQDYGMQAELFNTRMLMEEANRRQAMTNMLASAAALGADLDSTITPIGKRLAPAVQGRLDYRFNRPLVSNLQMPTLTPMERTSGTASVNSRPLLTPLTHISTAPRPKK